MAFSGQQDNRRPLYAVMVRISQPQSLEFISVLYDVFFLTELRRGRRQVVYGRAGFLFAS